MLQRRFYGFASRECAEEFIEKMYRTQVYAQECICTTTPIKLWDHMDGAPSPRVEALWKAGVDYAVGVTAALEFIDSLDRIVAAHECAHH